MLKSKVWNRGESDYTEKFKDKEITVPAGGFIIMNTYDAAEFNGQYPGKGVIKMLRVEDIPGNEDGKPHICNMCAESFASDELLVKHLRTHKPMEDNAQESEDSESLKARIAELEAQLIKSKPGPKPKKDLTHDTGTNTRNG
jgi:hypothetical protein